VLKILIILPLAKDRSKHLWITASINIFLADGSTTDPKTIIFGINPHLKMKKFFSTAYSEGAFNIATMALRLTFGLMLLIDHGLDKITHFSNYEYGFFDLFHIGHRISLILCIFAEVFCSVLVVLGLFTRFAALVLVINMSVASFMALKGKPLSAHELAFFYLAAFFSILLVGPGRISVDGAMGK
jgi:putative oxidoreductase